MYSSSLLLERKVRSDMVSDKVPLVPLYHGPYCCQYSAGQHEEHEEEDNKGPLSAPPNNTTNARYPDGGGDNAEDEHNNAPSVV